MVVVRNQHITLWHKIFYSTITNLYDMVLEANVLFLLTASVLNIEYTDQISSPASNQSIKYLK